MAVVAGNVAVFGRGERRRGGVSQGQDDGQPGAGGMDKLQGKEVVVLS